jgi:hypothetical protein
VRFAFVIVIIFAVLSVIGQERLYLPVADTIDMTYRSGGKELDSVDAVNIGLVNLRPAGGFSNLYEFNLPRHLFAQPAGFNYLLEQKRAPILFSGLPYLGFQYAFGSYLNQAVNLDFHQYYSKNSHLHLRYHRRASNGGLRNSGFSLNDFNARYFYGKNRWKMNMDVYFGSFNFNENAGLQTDTLLQDFDIAFTPVRINRAESRVRNVDVNWQNYYRIIGDSVLHQGLKFQTRYELIGRTYTEPAIGGVTYDDFFIDTLTTRDQYQTASIKNGGGYYFSSSVFQFDGTINHRFWRYQNLGTFRDTNEVFLHSNLWMKLAGFEFRNEFYFNILGALGEFYNRSNLQGKVFNNFKLNAGLNFDNRLPLPHQRFYQANNVAWQLQELNLQQLLNINGQMAYGERNKLIARLDWTTVTNGLFFINNEWRQDTLSAISVGQLRVNSELHAGKWAFYPGVTFGFNTANYNYQPAFSTRNRIVYKTKMFKTQALELALGADIGYDVAYNHLTYNHLVGTMDPVFSPFETQAMFRANAFAAIQVEQFRFFLRGENIDYFWNDNTIRIDPNFPIMPFIVRIGLTWDFFN